MSATTGVQVLPDGFAELEPYAPEWCLPTINERHQLRMSSNMQELQAFYDVAAPRIEDAIVHLNQFDLDDLPDPELHLFWLLGTLSVISFAVDVFKQPKVPDSGDGDLPVTVEPGP